MFRSALIRFLSTCTLAFFALLGCSKEEVDEAAEQLARLVNAPSNIQIAVDANTNSILVSWVDNSNDETGFRVLNNGVQVLKEVGINVTSTPVTLQAGITYLISVVAINGQEVSQTPPGQKIIMAPVSNVAPVAPENLVVTAVSDRALNLAWNDKSNNENGFVIERRKPDLSYEEVGLATTNQVSFVVGGLTGGTEYCFRLRAFNNIGFSAYLGPVCQSTLPPVPTGPPAAPSSLGGVAQSTQTIRVSWNDNSTGSTNEANFQLERTKVTGGQVMLFDVPADSTWFDAVGLEQASAYSFRLRAVNSAGESAWIGPITVSTLVDPTLAPAAPTNVTPFLLPANEIKLTFIDNSDSESRFRVYRKKDGGAYAAHATVDANTSPTNNVVTFRETLTLDGVYRYKIRAERDVNNSMIASADSNEANISFIVVPAAPTNLVLDQITHESMRLTWNDNSNNEEGFKVYRSLNGVNFTEITGNTQTPSGTTVSLTDTGLSHTTQYFYQVVAFRLGVTSPFAANNATTAPLPQRPDPRVVTGVTVISNSALRVGWTNPPSDRAVSIRVLQRMGTGAFTPLPNELPASAVSLDVTGLEANTLYTYKLIGVNAGGLSDESNEGSATTLLNAPPAPTNLQAGSILTQNTTQVRWEHSSVSNNAVASFVILRSTDNSSNAVFEIAGNAGAADRIFTDGGRTANTQYYYKVKAVNNGGSATSSQTLGIKTLPFAPQAPTGLVAIKASDTAIGLTWNHAGLPVDGFKIFRRRDGQSTIVELSQQASGTQRFFLDTGLANDTLYHYFLVAFNLGGDSAASNIASDRTVVGSQVGAPSGLILTVRAFNRIDLTWVDNTSNESGMDLYRQIGTGGFQVRQHYNGSLTMGAMAFEDSTVVQNTTYSYKVCVPGPGTTQLCSNIVTGTTFFQPPPAPTGLTATTLSNSQIQLTWNHNSPLENHFEVYQATTLDGTYTRIAYLGANDLDHVAINLSPNTQYFYKVRAENHGVFSGETNIANATTNHNAPAAPSSLTATALSQTEVTLTWLDNSDNESHFDIFVKLDSAASFPTNPTLSIGGTTGTGTTVTKVVPGLAANTLYDIAVKARNNGGRSAFSNIRTVRTLPNPPAAPSNLRMGASGTLFYNQLTILWNDNSSNEVAFDIYRKAPNGNFVLIDSVGANVTSYIDLTVFSRTVYQYQVKARNLGGSTVSNTLSATVTPNEPSGAPRMLVASQFTINSIQLDWENTSGNASVVKIERKPANANGSCDPSTGYTQIATVAGNQSTYTNTGLAANTAFCYRVRADNGNGVDSAYSNVAPGKTLAQ